MKSNLFIMSVEQLNSETFNCIIILRINVIYQNTGVTTIILISTTNCTYRFGTIDTSAQCALSRLFGVVLCKKIQIDKPVGD